MTFTERGQPRILVVDDNESVQLVLSLGLVENGFDVMTAASGEEGLKLARSQRPDVILLDVMMPRLSGHEVCQQLQDDEHTRNIPIIFLSARTTTPDRVKGLESGAVDYVTKPFDMTEVLTRIRVALRTGQRQKEQERALEQRKKEFVHLLSHEMATPLSAIHGFTELLEAGLSRMNVASQLDCLREIGRSSRILAGTLDDMLALAESETFSNRKPMDLVQIVRDVTDELAGTREEQAQSLRLDLPSQANVIGHPRFLPRAVHALVSNAQKFGGRHNSIDIQLQSDPDTVRLTVADAGPGVPEKDFERIFERFYQRDASRTRAHAGMGVGLAVARRVARALGGDVTLQSVVGKGSRFVLSLPHS